VSGRDWPQQSSATLRPASAQTSSRRSQAALGESAEPCLNARTEQAVPPCKQKEHEYELRYDSLDDLVRPLLDPRLKNAIAVIASSSQSAAVAVCEPSMEARSAQSLLLRGAPLRGPRRDCDCAIDGWPLRAQSAQSDRSLTFQHCAPPRSRLPQR
jgi:hypothetical protein